MPVTGSSRVVPVCHFDRPDEMSGTEGTEYKGDASPVSTPIVFQGKPEGGDPPNIYGPPSANKHNPIEHTPGHREKRPTRPSLPSLAPADNSLIREVTKGAADPEGIENCPITGQQLVKGSIFHLPCGCKFSMDGLKVYSSNPDKFVNGKLPCPCCSQEIPLSDRSGTLLVDGVELDCGDRITRKELEALHEANSGKSFPCPCCNQRTLECRFLNRGETIKTTPLNCCEVAYRYMTRQMNNSSLGCRDVVRQKVRKGLYCFLCVGIITGVAGLVLLVSQD